MRFESKYYLHQDPWAPVKQTADAWAHPQPSKSEVLWMELENSTKSKFPGKFLHPLAFEDHLASCFLKQRCLYLGLIIEFTGNMNCVVVLVCTMTPRAWSWASSAVAPGQLFGKWAGEQQAAPSTYWLSKTSANTLVKENLQSPVILLIKANYSCQDQSSMETHNQKKLRNGKEKRLIEK